MKFGRQLTSIAAIGMLLFASQASAGLITTAPAGAQVIDFSTQPTVSNVPGPIQIGTPVGEDIEFTGAPNTGLYTNFNGWGLVSNGTWGDGMTYISTNDARPGSMFITFNDGPVSSVGGFMNHAPDFDTDLIIRALAADMTVLEEYNITLLAPIITPGGLNEGGFRGISRATADIAIFEVYGYVQVLDDLTFTRGEGRAPAPAVPALLAAALLALGLVRRRS